MLKILIKLYTLLLAIVGSVSMVLFFPSPRGCSGFGTCLMYSLCGMAMLFLSIGLFFLSNLTRKCMLWFSSFFIAFFIFQVAWLIKTDFTGQGLAGMMLVVPMFLICLSGVFFLLFPKVKSQFITVADD